MGFCKKLLVILFSFMCFSVPVLAQEKTNTPAISDFTIHRVTPVKTSANKISTAATPTLRSDKKSEKELEKKHKKKLIVETTQQSSKNSTEQSTKNSKSNSTKSSRLLAVSETKTPKTSQKTSNITSNAGEKTVDSKSSEPDKSLDINKINQINEHPVDNTAKKSAVEWKHNKVDNYRTILFNLFSGLCGVLLIIYLCVQAYAKYKGIDPSTILMGKPAGKDLNKFNVLFSSTLGQGKDIHLVEINGKQLVIGSTANNINLLTEISPEEIEKLKDEKQHTKTTESNETNKIAGSIEPPEEKTEDDYVNAEYYSLQYSEVYKEYLEKDK